jgi:GNAT superfamily N-acetyltransferase
MNRLLHDLKQRALSVNRVSDVGAEPICHAWAMVEQVSMRIAGVQDAPGLSDLMVQSEGITSPASGVETDELREALSEWLARSDVVCALADRQSVPVGMAWMVFYARVPNLGNVVRHFADVQSVFVAPSYRGRGLGQRLIGLLCEAADTKSVIRMTVHSSARATNLYQRSGFTQSPVLLQREAQQAIAKGRR